MSLKQDRCQFQASHGPASSKNEFRASPLDPGQTGSLSKTVALDDTPPLTLHESQDLWYQKTELYEESVDEIIELGFELEKRRKASNETATEEVFQPKLTNIPVNQTFVSSISFPGEEKVETFLPLVFFGYILRTEWIQNAYPKYPCISASNLVGLKLVWDYIIDSYFISSKLTIGIFGWKLKRQCCGITYARLEGRTKYLDGAFLNEDGDLLLGYKGNGEIRLGRQDDSSYMKSEINKCLQQMERFVVDEEE